MPHAILTPEQISLAGRIEAELSKLVHGEGRVSRRAMKRLIAVVMPALDQLDAITDDAAFDALLDRCPLLDSFLDFASEAAFREGISIAYANGEYIVWKAS